MKILPLWLRRTLIGSAIVVAVLCGWYIFDRPSLLSIACEAGLPNGSRPTEVDSEDLGCAILNSEREYSGIVITGFEASNFSSPDFVEVEEDKERGRKIAWFNCPREGCGPELEKQLSTNPFPGCRLNKRFDTGMAFVKVSGWVTISGGGYGHLNSYPREFYAKRIISVSPAPAAFVKEWRDAIEARKMCEIGPNSRLSKPSTSPAA